MWSKLAPLTVALLLGALLYAGVERSRTINPRDIPSPLLDKPAPAFTLTTVADPQREVSREDLLGEPFLLNVWGSWCPACRVEHPFITELAESDTIAVYGLNWKDTRSEAQRWLNQFGDPYRFSAFDDSGRVGIDFGVYGAPETFLIDRAGNIVYKYIGALNPQVWNDEFLPRLSQIENP